MQGQELEGSMRLVSKHILGRAVFCVPQLSSVKLYEEATLITHINSFIQNINFHVVGFVVKTVGTVGDILRLEDCIKTNQKITTNAANVLPLRAGK